MQATKGGMHELSYPTVVSMNQNNDQNGKISLNVQKWHLYLGGNQQLCN